MRKVIFAVLFMVFQLSAELDWKCVGLEGTEVTSIIRVDEEGSENFSYYLIGTGGEGVYIKRGEEIKPIMSNVLFESPLAIESAEVYALEVMNNSIFAATDKGVWRYPLTESVAEYEMDNGSFMLSHWIMCDIPATDIYDLEILNVREAEIPGRRYMVAASDDSIYRGHFVHEINREEAEDIINVDSLYTMEWEVLPATDTLPGGMNDANFRTLLNYRNYIYAGSVLGGSNSSWSGILKTEDNGVTWGVWEEALSTSELHVFIPSYQSGEPVYLAAVKSLSDPDNTVYSKKGGSETEPEWEENESLRMKGVNAFYTTYSTESEVARVHAAADSGVYLFTGEVAIPEADAWTLMRNSPKHTNSLAANISDMMEYDSLFAATDKGLYLYTDFDDAGTFYSGSDIKGEGVSKGVIVNTNSSGISIANLPAEKDLSIRIYDLKGSLVYNETGIGSSMNAKNIDRNLFSQGNYILDIKTSNTHVSKGFTVIE